MSKQLGAARRRRHVGPSANQERNIVGLLDTPKIKIYFRWPRGPAGAAKPMKKAPLGHSYNKFILTSSNWGYIL